MLRNNSYKSIYRNLFDDFNKEFLIPSYRESKLALRASGFFSLESLVMSSEGLFDFIKNRGKLKIICSPILSESDVAKIESGQTITEDDAIVSILNEITIEKDLNELDRLKLDLICNLISSNIIELKIAFTPDGIYHEKFGLFVDEEGEAVYFNGSFNSTKNGFINNTESFLVHTSWNNQSATINQERKYFDDLWNGKVEKVVTLTFPETAKNALFQRFKSTDSVDDSLFNLVKKLSGKKVKNLWEFQERAIKEFVDNGFAHFYEMATGTGKTFTTIRTIKQVTKIKNKCFVMILVPQIDLQNQWMLALKDDEIEEIFPIGGIALKSEQEFNEAIIHYNLFEETVVCVAVYDTFFEKYYSRIEGIKGLFIIVDEAHNLTSNYFSKLPKNPDYKLGLSATIERWSKTETSNIKNYFTDGRETFFYGIEDAIKAKFLAPYEYHPIFVHLDDEDFAKFRAKTKALAQKLNDDDKDEDEIQRLRTERSLIIKKASCKLDKLREMVKDQSKYDFRNAVVYCGMGKDNEDTIIDSVSRILSENDRYVVSQYTSKTENRIEVLFEFENGYFDTLIAIKCFDEGVDVPKLDKIYILASDASRRQTVQRRGRVLRQCKETNKEIAYIYDLVVLPPLGVFDGSGVPALLMNEFIRVAEYASLCTNKSINQYIDDTLSEYNYKLEDLLNGQDEYN